MYPNTTQVPNIIFDVYLRTLKPAELKVLLVVNRQTLGWLEDKETKRRKERDWISGSQLRDKTGYSRRAITYATEALVQKGLIEVYDSEGVLLDTPDKRKGQMRLYYRLAIHPVQKVRKGCAKSAQEPAHKVPTTKETRQKKLLQNCEQKFTWEEYLKELEESNQRHLNVIAFFFRKKNLSYDTKAKADIAMKRHLKAAALVREFSDEEIAKVVNHLCETFPQFTVETIYKHLTK